MVREASIHKKLRLKEMKEKVKMDKTKSQLSASDRNNIVAFFAEKEGLLRGKWSK